MSPNKDLFIITKKQKFILIGLMSFAALAWLLPMVTVIANSLKVGGFSNYLFVISEPVNGVPFWKYFVNSSLIAIGASLMVTFISSTAGFAFSKIDFFGRDIIFISVVMCLAISASVIYIPLFYIFKSLKIYNTYFSVIFSEVLLTLPFGVLLMKNYFDSLPNSLLESATIDGGSLYNIFYKIYLPMTKPAIINLAVLQIMWSFQDFFFPLVFLTDKNLFTATIAINVYKGMFGSVAADLGYLNAALVLIGIPSLLVFLIAEKFITSGITSGALKE